MRAQRKLMVFMGTGIAVFKAAVARYLGCLSEEGLAAEGESRGASATEKAKGRVVVMKRPDGSVTALQGYKYLNWGYK